MSENQTSQEIPEALRKQLSEAGKKGIKKLSRAARIRGGRRSAQGLTHEEHVARGKRAWLARLEKAKALAEKLEREAKTV